MLGINLKHTLATVTVAAGILATAGSASAGTHPSGLVLYNGHAGLGASVTDGTSNTIMFGTRAAAPKAAVIESIGTKYTISSPPQVDASKKVARYLHKHDLQPVR
jgi:hypothetical protein